MVYYDTSIVWCKWWYYGSLYLLTAVSSHWFTEEHKQQRPCEQHKHTSRRNQSAARLVTDHHGWVQKTESYLQTLMRRESEVSRDVLLVLWSHCMTWPELKSWIIDSNSIVYQWNDHIDGKEEVTTPKYCQLICLIFISAFTFTLVKDGIPRITDLNSTSVRVTRVTLG